MHGDGEVIGAALTGAAQEVLEIRDDGEVVVRHPDGHLETLVIPLERVPEYRRTLLGAEPGLNGPAKRSEGCRSK